MCSSPVSGPHAAPCCVAVTRVVHIMMHCIGGGKLYTNHVGNRFPSQLNLPGWMRVGVLPAPCLAFQRLPPKHCPFNVEREISSLERESHKGLSSPMDARNTTEQRRPNNLRVMPFVKQFTRFKQFTRSSRQTPSCLYTSCITSPRVMYGPL